MSTYLLGEGNTTCDTPGVFNVDEIIIWPHNNINFTATMMFLFKIPKIKHLRLYTIILATVLLLHAPFTYSETNSEFENSSPSDNVIPTRIIKEDGSYYLGNKELSFGFAGGELYEELVKKPETLRYANSARKHYKAGTIVLIPTATVGTILLVAGSRAERNKYFINNKAVKAIGGTLLAVGLTVKVILMGTGNRRYEVAIERYNAAN